MNTDDDLGAARSQLCEEGFCVVPGVLDRARTAEVRERLVASAAESERRGRPTVIPGLDPNEHNVRVFNLLDSDSVRAWRYVGEHFKRTPEPGLRIFVPYWVAGMAVRLIHRVSILVSRGRGKLPSILVPTRFAARFKPVRFTSRRLRDELGWRGPYNFNEALERTYKNRDSDDPGQTASQLREPG